MQRRRDKFVVLNYSLPKELSSRLDNYCDQTGRTASEVVRQLVLEYVEGDRVLVGQVAHRAAPTDARSSLRLRSATLRAFEDKLSTERTSPTRGAALSTLLANFLDRTKAPAPRVIVPVPVSTAIISILTSRAAVCGLSLDEHLAEIIQSSVGRPEPVESES